MLTTPATASEPYRAEPPSSTTSIRAMAMSGTRAETAVSTERTPSIRVRVLFSPRPRRLKVAPVALCPPVSSGVDVGDCIGVLGIGQVADVLTHVRRAGLVQVILPDIYKCVVLGALAVADCR